jgi:hypothetical protein
MELRCECPHEANGSAMAALFAPEERAGMIHAPNECRGAFNLAVYLRNGEEITLCSCCHLFGDEFVREAVVA